MALMPPKLAADNTCLVAMPITARNEPRTYKKNYFAKLIESIAEKSFLNNCKKCSFG